MTRTCDRWAAMLAALSGSKPPPLPELPGHRHKAPHPEGDPAADAWGEAHRDDGDDAEDRP